MANRITTSQPAPKAREAGNIARAEQPFHFPLHPVQQVAPPLLARAGPGDVAGLVGLRCGLAGRDSVRHGLLLGSNRCRLKRPSLAFWNGGSAAASLYAITWRSEQGILVVSVLPARLAGCHQRPAQFHPVVNTLRSPVPQAGHQRLAEGGRLRAGQP